MRKKETCFLQFRTLYSVCNHRTVCPVFPGGSDGKEYACHAGDLGSIPGSGTYSEKGMATHSSILAWRIPWAEDTGRLQSIGSQRVRHN